MGIVEYAGHRSAGRHEHLISQDTFDRVQMLLTGHRVSGDRAQLHQHYLRGTIVCDECLGRLLFGRHRGKSGLQYEYFCCTHGAARRRETRCSSGRYGVDEVERRVEEHYATVRLSPQVQTVIRREVTQALGDRAAVIEREAERHERTLKQIEAKQEKLVQLNYRDLVSEGVFEREQDKLKAERRAAGRLRTVASARLVDIEEALEIALKRVIRPRETYLAANSIERRILNQSIFVHIEIGAEGEITDVTLTPTYEALVAWEPSLGRPRPDRHGSCS